MAPERLQCREFDGRSDIFSTGVMLYQLLSGHLPFGGEDYAAIQKVLNEPYLPLTTYLSRYPGDLDTILLRALAKEPEDRYATAEEMASEISNLTEQLKKDQVVEMFQQAERLVENEDYVKARELLLKLAKLDSKHVGARQLMVLVQQSLAKRQRAAQIQQLRAQADDAHMEKRFGDAITLLEQALKLDPTSSELAAELENLRQKKARHELVGGCCAKSRTPASGKTLRALRRKSREPSNWTRTIHGYARSTPPWFGRSKRRIASPRPGNFLNPRGARLGPGISRPPSSC